MFKAEDIRGAVVKDFHVKHSMVEIEFEDGRSVFMSTMMGVNQNKATAFIEGELFDPARADKDLIDGPPTFQTANAEDLET